MSSKQAVRKQRNNEGWCIADEARAFFSGGFPNGLMLDIKFVHDAKPMACIKGYESTGEAIGNVAEKSDRPLEMPVTAKRTADIVYDRTNRKFHVKDKPEEIVDDADYLVLGENGSAIAGWKK